MDGPKSGSGVPIQKQAAKQVEQRTTSMRGWMIEDVNGLAPGTFAHTERAAKVTYMLNCGVRLLPHHDDAQIEKTWASLCDQNKDKNLEAVQVNIEKVLGTA